MNSVMLRVSVAVVVVAAVPLSPALAQRFIPPEQRVERLERQVQQLQRRVFPQGQPADTAGFPAEPAATQASVSNLDNRLIALERQVAEIIRYSETNSNRLSMLEAELTRLRDENRAQIRKIEQSVTRPVQSVSDTAGPSRPAVSTPPASEAPTGPAAETDEGELAYDAGYQLWRDGKYDQAITALRAMASSFPRHRRVSWANNLAGRAMLDKGEPRAAAEALLANYRGNPRGERAADSLFYLGQALMKLNQKTQACKAYAELEAVYGERMRGELKTLLPKAKADAGC